MHNIRRVNPNNITPPIESLEYYFRSGGVTIIQAAFSHSFFVDPDVVRARTTYHPDRARYSRRYYRNLGKGEAAIWKGKDRNRPVTLDDNAYAHSAWQGYTGCPMQRGTGYGLRHIWGHPRNPDSFTAGWNLCYMPFWAGMLTENHHPLPELQRAIKQASWDLYFGEDPVCNPPDFVKDPGLDLSSTLGESPLLIMEREAVAKSRIPKTRDAVVLDSSSDSLARLKMIRLETHQSWTNIAKAVLALQGKSHKPFGTHNVEASSKSCVRKICRETELNLSDLEALLSQVTSIEDQML